MARDPLKTIVCERFGCEYPIFAFTHYPEVAAAVTNAGGVGVLGAGWGNDPKGPEALRERIRMVKKAVGDRPFGVDLILPASVPDEATPEAMAAMIPEEHRRFARTIKEEYAIPTRRARSLSRRSPGSSSGRCSTCSTRRRCGSSPRVWGAPPT